MPNLVMWPTTMDDFAEITGHGPMLERDLRNVVLVGGRTDRCHVGGVATQRHRGRSGQ
jgi:hypothetical protein